MSFHKAFHVVATGDRGGTGVPVTIPNIHGYTLVTDPGSGSGLSWQPLPAGAPAGPPVTSTAAPSSSTVLASRTDGVTWSALLTLKATESGSLGMLEIPSITGTVTAADITMRLSTSLGTNSVVAHATMGDSKIDVLLSLSGSAINFWPEYQKNTGAWAHYVGQNISIGPVVIPYVKGQTSA